MDAITRPATAAGWAPPFTDTPDEIRARRQAALDLEEDLHAERYTTGQRLDRAIAAGLAEPGAA